MTNATTVSENGLSNQALSEDQNITVDVQPANSEQIFSGIQKGLKNLHQKGEPIFGKESWMGEKIQNIDDHPMFTALSSSFAPNQIVMGTMPKILAALGFVGTSGIVADHINNHALSQKITEILPKVGIGGFNEGGHEAIPFTDVTKAESSLGMSSTQNPRPVPLNDPALSSLTQDGEPDIISLLTNEGGYVQDQGFFAQQDSTFSGDRPSLNADRINRATHAGISMLNTPEENRAYLKNLEAEIANSTNPDEKSQLQQDYNSAKRLAELYEQEN
jgi:hypothetical protein